MGGCSYGGGGGGRGGGGTQGPGQGRPGQSQQQFLSPRCCRRESRHRFRGHRPCVDLQRRWGCPATKSEPKPRKEAARQTTSRENQEEARPGPARGRLSAWFHSHQAPVPCGAATAAPAAAATRMPELRGPRRGNRYSRHPTRTPDTHDCW